MIKKKENIDEKSKELLLDYRENNNEDSFNKLVKLIEKPLFNKIRFYIQDYDEAKDIFQKTIIKMKEKIPEYDIQKNTSVLTWVFSKIAYGLILHWYRDKKNSVTVFLDPDYYSSESESILDSSLIQFSNPEDILINKEKFKKIHKAIKNLNTETYQDVVIMHHFGNIQLKELSNIMNENYATIRTWHDRAKTQLFNLLRNII